MERGERGRTNEAGDKTRENERDEYDIRRTHGKKRQEERVERGIQEEGKRKLVRRIVNDYEKEERGRMS